MKKFFNDLFALSCGIALLIFYILIAFWPVWLVLACVKYIFS